MGDDHPPLAGAWMLDSGSQDGLAVFTRSHYGVVVADRKRPAPSLTTDLTPADAAALFRSFTASVGTYELKDSTLVRRALMSKVPAEDATSRSSVHLDGERLTWAAAEDFGHAWHRVSGLGVGPLVGAWTLESEAIDDLSVSSATHSVNFATQSGRSALSLSGALEDGQAAELWRSIRFASGTRYWFADSTVRSQVIVAADPESVGSESRREVLAEGNRLTITTLAVPGLKPGIVFTARRVG